MKLNTFDIDELETQDFPQEERQEFLPVEYALEKELRDEVLNSLNQLPEKQRISIVLFYYEGLKYHEIAEVMGTNIQDVANSISRGKKKLKELLVIDDTASEKIITKNQIGAASVITFILRSDAEEVVTPVMCQAFEGKLVAAIGASSSGVASTLAMTKLATSVIVGLTVVAGGLTAVSMMRSAGNDATQQPSQEELAGLETSGNSKETDRDSTLEEGIAGLPLPSDASDGSSTEKTVGDVYDQFVDSGQTEDGWNDFVDTVRAQYYSHIVGTQYRFDVYCVSLEPDQQPLVVIARIDDQNQVSLAFQQVDEQSIPRQKDIIRAFEQWRE